MWLKTRESLFVILYIFKLNVRLLEIPFFFEWVKRKITPFQWIIASKWECWNDLQEVGGCSVTKPWDHINTAFRAPEKTDRAGEEETTTLRVLHLLQNLSYSFKFYFDLWLEALIMRLGVLAFLVLGTCSLRAWCVPLKSVYVTFPGDVIKNMTNTQLADVSISSFSSWFLWIFSHLLLK